MIQQRILGQGRWKRRSSNCRVLGIAVRELPAFMHQALQRWPIYSLRSVLGVEELDFLRCLPKLSSQGPNILQGSRRMRSL